MYLNCGGGTAKLCSASISDTPPTNTTVVSSLCDHRHLVDFIVRQPGSVLSSGNGRLIFELTRLQSDSE